MFKQNLEVATEKIRFDFQKKIQNYNLYVQRKFSAYEELQRFILTAESRLTSLYGFRSEPTYEEYNQEDFTLLLEKNNFTKGKIGEMLYYYNDKDKFLKMIRKLLRFKEVRDSDLSINGLRNHYWLSKLYLSDDVDQKTNNILDKMTTLQVIYEMLEDIPSNYQGRKDEYNKSLNIKAEIRKLVPELGILIKKELSVF